MLHALVIALGAAIVYLALRWVRRESDRVEASMRRVNLRIRRANAEGVPLVFDAAERFFRPAE